MNGEVRVVEDVPEAYAALVESAAQERSADDVFRLAISGGSSGRRCLERLVARDVLHWDAIELFQVDERRVPKDSPASNVAMFEHVLGTRLSRLAGFHPMSFEAGAESYEQCLLEAGGLDAVQLGFGPDGHTASLFPHSAGLSAPKDRLVVVNSDPSGANPHERMTLTFTAISWATLVVITVLGADKAPAFSRLVAGEDLPAGRISAEKLVWLVEPAASAGVAKINP